MGLAIIIQLTFDFMQTSSFHLYLSTKEKKILMSACKVRQYFVMVIYKSIYDGANSCLNQIKHSDSANDINISLLSQEVHECYVVKFVGVNCAVNSYTVVL